jgi:hypothetical protein
MEDGAWIRYPGLVGGEQSYLLCYISDLNFLISVDGEEPGSVIQSLLAVNKPIYYVICLT